MNSIAGNQLRRVEEENESLKGYRSFRCRTWWEFLVSWKNQRESGLWDFWREWQQLQILA